MTHNTQHDTFEASNRRSMGNTWDGVPGQVYRQSRVPILTPRHQPLQVFYLHFRPYPSFEDRQIILKMLLNGGGIRQLVRSWAGLSRQIRGVVYTCTGVIPDLIKTGLGIGGKSVLPCFFSRGNTICQVLFLLWPQTGWSYVHHCYIEYLVRPFITGMQDCLRFKNGSFLPLLFVTSFLNFLVWV